IPGSDIQLIHEIGDCFFSLTHSEGWGLGAFDAAAAGNPVIITGWGGQLDYLPVDSSYHVRHVLKPLQETTGWDSYERSHQWAYADRDDAVRKLRHCYQNRKEAKAKGMQLQAFVDSRFSTEQVTSDLLRAINEAHSE
ncbi:MAG: glycosyltransferase, partial [Gammaproteobacteria bacterium]|nr:glycosyltransferase [Gammaproteobacteria bacterium]